MHDRSARPLVAISTPVYNGARYLAETMACVQAQTYDNLIHLVVDNASTDETPRIIDSFKGKRVPVVSLRNPATVPMADNWNAAARLAPAQAAYFRILPADDLILPQGIEKMVAVGERHPEVGIIGCQELMGTALVGNDLSPDHDVFDGRAIVRGSLLNAIHGFPHLHCLYRVPPGGLADPFYETEFHGTELLCIDSDAAMRALARGPYGFVHEPLVVTRLHEGSQTSTVVSPTRMKMWQELQLIDRWGPIVFDSEQAYRRCRAKHLRYYYRYLLMWRAKRQWAHIEQHSGLLGRAAAVPRLLDYAAAIAEWPMRHLAKGLRRAAVGAGLAPRHQRF
jgi:glycosyltransferase involved in cell wall biosynthesis